MARNQTIKLLRTTRANLDSQKVASGLLAGEPYLITDEGKLAVGTAVNEYAETGAPYHGIVRTSAAQAALPQTVTTVFTLGATANPLDYYFNGTKVSVTTDQSTTTFVGQSAGLYYVYFNAKLGAIAFGAFPGLTTASNVIIASVLWNGSNLGLVQDEMHQHDRNLIVHLEAHTTTGCRYSSGLDVTLTANSMTVSAGVINDDGMPFTVPASSAFPTPNAYRIFYQTGASAYSFDSAVSTLPYKADAGNGNRPQYVRSDTHALVTLANATNRYLNFFCYAATDKHTPIYVFAETASNAALGVTGYTSLTAARAVAWPNLSNFGLSREMRPIHRIIVRADGQVQVYAAADDYRTVSSLPMAAGTAATSANIVTETNYGNVQTAIDTLITDKSPTAHNQAFSTITTTPTTLSGYGITDAVTTDTTQTITGLKTLAGSLTLSGASSNLTIPSTAKLYLDSGGDSYITESSANVLDTYCGGNLLHRLTSTTAQYYQTLSGTKINFLSSTVNATAENSIAIITTVNTNSTVYTNGLGVYTSNTVISSGVTDSGYIIGITSVAYISNATNQGTLTTNHGVLARAGINITGVGSVITNASAVYAEILNNSVNGTITNAYGVYIANGGTTGTITNRWGLYQADAIANNAFAGKVRIGSTTAPTVALDVTGAVKISDTTDATSKDTGCLVIEGGIGVEKSVFAGGNIISGGQVVAARTVTDANATMAATDYTIRMSTGASNRTVNLSAAVAGQIVVIKKIDSGAGTVTFVSGTSCTIDGSTTRALSAQYESLTLQCVTAGASCVFDII